MTIQEAGSILVIGGGAHTLTPLYDGEDSVCGMEYDGAAYYFLKNLQGDVIALTDADGETLARYRYDAWGKLLSVTDRDGSAISDPHHPAFVNPFRYRSYYYDAETGLYYLQSRYYDPEVGRFVNGDAVEAITSTVSSTFCYCVNAPVTNVDDYGTIPRLMIYPYIPKNLDRFVNTIKSIISIKTAFLSSWLLNRFLALQRSITGMAGNAVSLAKAISNYIHNSKIQKSLPERGYIVNQLDKRYERWHLGFSNLKNCGCELIAVYNVLLRLGKWRDLATLALEFEMLGFVMGFGYFGSNPAGLYNYFNYRKIGYGMTYNLNYLNTRAKTAKAVIVSCWNKGFAGLHTFMVRYVNGRFYSYNGYESRPFLDSYSSLSQAMKGNRFIVGYWF